MQLHVGQSVHAYLHAHKSQTFTIKCTYWHNYIARLGMNIYAKSRERVSYLGEIDKSVVCERSSILIEKDICK